MATRESLILDSVELNDITSTYVLREVDFTPPKKRYEWITGADTDGAELSRDPLFEQRTITAVLRVNQQATMDLALQKIAAVTAKLEEAEQQPDGLPLVWTPANSTKSLTFYVQSGEITGIPVVRTGDERGWFRNYPVLHVTMTCKPYGYRTSSNTATATAATPLVTIDVPNVGGDVPAEARVVVTDAASQARRDVIWGLEQRYYTPGSPAALTIPAGSLVTAGFGGTATTLAGAYLSNVVSASIAGQATAVCGTGNQPHIGTYRVRARVQAADVVRFRLAWQDGDGPFGANPWVPVPAGGWCELDLGPITIAPAAAGTQRWTGRVEAYTTDGSAQTVYVNLLELIPAGEGYGRARASYSYRPGVVVARDDFAGLADAAALNGRTAQVGGAWTTAGATGDFVGYAPGIAVEVRRSTTDASTGRFAVVGSAMTSMEVGARAYAWWPNLNDANFGVTARYVDTSNAVRATINPKQNVFTVGVRIAGSESIHTVSTTLVEGVSYYIKLVVYASGTIYATLSDFYAGTQVATIAVPPGAYPALQTGGALASGKAGLYDIGLAGGQNRELDDFYSAIPATEPIVVNASQSIEFRHDNQLRQDATGTYYGRPPTYRGSSAWLPPAGDKNRTSRVVVAARRNDTDGGADGGVTDSTTVQVFWTERHLVVPH